MTEKKMYSITTYGVGIPPISFWKTLGFPTEEFGNFCFRFILEDPICHHEPLVFSKNSISSKNLAEISD
jgi:hypothetical protein